IEICRKKSLSLGLFSNFSYATGTQNVENVCFKTITNATKRIAAEYKPNSPKSLHCLRAILSNDSNNQVIKIVKTKGAPYVIISRCECLTSLTFAFFKFQKSFPRYITNSDKINNVITLE